MKKNFLMLFSAAALMLGTVMFASCDKDEIIVANGNGAQQDNPVATLNATFDEVDAVMSQYDFHELQPLMTALSQTDKASKGPVRDFFVNGRDKIRVFDSIARNRLADMLKNMLPSYENPFVWQGSFANRDETFSLAWKLTSYLSNGNTLNARSYDTIFVVADDGSEYTIYAENVGIGRISLGDRQFSSANGVRLVIMKDGEEVLSFMFVIEGRYNQGSTMAIAGAQMTYKDMNVVHAFQKKADNTYMYGIRIANADGVIMQVEAEITPEGGLRDRTYPTLFTMVLLPSSRNVHFNGTIADLKTFAEYYKSAKEMMTNGGTKEDCDALVANLNEAASIHMTIASNGSDVTFDTQSVTVGDETVYQPVMMIKLENARYPMTLNRFFEGLGIDMDSLLANLRRS